MKGQKKSTLKKNISKLCNLSEKQVHTLSLWQRTIYQKHITVAGKTTCQDSNLSEMIQVFLSFKKKKTPSVAGEDNVMLRGGDEYRARLNFSLLHTENSLLSINCCIILLKLG